MSTKRKVDQTLFDVYNKHANKKNKLQKIPLPVDKEDDDDDIFGKIIFLVSSFNYTLILSL